jgi:thiol-disulfide isomerase/thioredoxin
MAKGKKKSVDVRAKKDVAEFEKTLSLGPITLVLIYADWCGHCKNFKKDIWNDLEAIPNKKINLASVHFDQVGNTSIKDAKINGYPSLLVIGNDKKPATFNVDGEITNALPNTRNKEMLKTMVVSDPQNLTNTLESNTIAVVPTANSMNEVQTLNFQPETLEKRKEINTTLEPIINEIQGNFQNNTTIPPDTSLDRLPTENEFLNSAKRNLVATGVLTENEFNTAIKQKGGSLLSTLMKLAQETAPAAGLLAAAAYRTKRKSRKSKKSKKRSTRRR